MLSFQGNYIFEYQKQDELKVKKNYLDASGDYQETTGASSKQSATVCQRKIGFNPKMVLQDFPLRMLCLLCGHIMKNPIQSSGGNLACKECYEDEKSKKDIVFENDDLDGSAFPDRATGIEIGQLQVKCEHVDDGCTWIGMLKEYEEHLKTCAHTPTQCFFCKTQISDFELHLPTCSHFTSLEECPYIGCNFKPCKETLLVDHFKEYAFFHMALQEPILNDMKSTSQELTKIIETTKASYEEMFAKQNKDIQKLLQKVTDLQTQITTINELNHRNLSTQNNEVSKDDLSNVAHTITLLERNLKDMDLKQQLLENTNYDGRLLWKIDNFKHRKSQVLAGKVNALHSAPCFTSRYGYKFCGRLYLNGDGIGKNTHLSFFFVLMKSEYDNINSFPMKNRVSLKLLNQAGNERDIIESFNPDINSSSFRKPSKNMNVAAGCPMFVSLEDFEKKDGYLKDDCFFLEIIVHQ